MLRLPGQFSDDQGNRQQRSTSRFPEQFSLLPSSSRGGMELEEHHNAFEASSSDTFSAGSVVLSQAQGEEIVFAVKDGKATPTLLHNIKTKGYHLRTIIPQAPCKYFKYSNS